MGVEEVLYSEDFLPWENHEDFKLISSPVEIRLSQEVESVRSVIRVHRLDCEDKRIFNPREHTNSSLPTRPVITTAYDYYLLDIFINKNQCYRLDHPLLNVALSVEYWPPRTVLGRVYQEIKDPFLRPVNPDNVVEMLVHQAEKQATLLEALTGIKPETWLTWEDLPQFTFKYEIPRLGLQKPVEEEITTKYIFPTS